MVRDPSSAVVDEPKGGSQTYAPQELTPALEALDSATNYADWLVDQVSPYLAGRILEVGAGSGTMSQRIRSFGALTATEPDPGLALLLVDRFRGTDVEVQSGDLNAVVSRGTFDSVVLINVLEHIEDDRDALRQLFATLENCGTAIVFVPAFEMLFSEFDRQIGHFRRYRRRDLRYKMIDAGFEIEELKYVNLPGWFAWLILARLLGQPPATGRKVQIYDRVAIPLIRFFEDRITPPFGQSVLCIGRKNVRSNN